MPPVVERLLSAYKGLKPTIIPVNAPSGNLVY